MNPYQILNISTVASLTNLFDQVAIFGDYSDKEREELTHLLEDKNENEKREILIDKLIEVKYHSLMKTRKQGKDLLSQAYSMISTPEKRKMYEQRRDYEKKYDCKKIDKYEKEQNKETAKDLSQRRIQEFLKKQTYTRNVTSMEQMESLKGKHKANYDPYKEFPNYTGYPYRWGVLLVNEITENYVEGINDRQERVIVTNLGSFHYGSLISRPTQEYPSGRNIACMEQNMIGITKIDSNNQIVRNDVMIAKLSENDKNLNRVFFLNTFVADELIDRANTQNNGFLGSVGVRENEARNLEYYIEYNGFFDSNLVSALELAKHINGNLCKRGEKVKIVGNK